MKKLLPYLLICLYTSSMIKPVMPYIIDSLGHILNYQGHIASVHAHYGKYHAHVEIAKAAKNDNSDKNTNTTKKDSLEKEYIGVDKDCVSLFQVGACKFATALPKRTISIYLNNDYPPPRV